MSIMSRAPLTFQLLVDCWTQGMDLTMAMLLVLQEMGCNYRKDSLGGIPCF